MPILSFFFHCSANPRDLHSFPTRRSSDLQSARARNVGAARLRHAHVAAGGLQRGVGARHIIRSKEPHPRDRKSTRLNSSHVRISYAVFCLKKKKTVKATTHERLPPQHQLT